MVEARADAEHEADNDGNRDSGHDGDGAHDERDDDGEHDDGHDGGHDEHEGDHHEPHIHMPSPSYWPLISSLGLAVVCYGLIFKFLPVVILGGLWIISSLYAWAMEPATEPEPPDEEPSTSMDLEPVSQAGS